MGWRSEMEFPSGEPEPNKSRETYIKEMKESFLDSINRCGGSPKSFAKDMHKLTLNDIFETLAQNGVRFTYVNDYQTYRADSNFHYMKKNFPEEFI